MKLRFITQVVIFLGFTSIGLAQQNVREEITLSVSNSNLIVGETLYYSAFVRSMKTGKLSELSKILYLEILNEEGTSVYQKKLTLENGVSHGKYFISSLTSTGNYSVVAYTRWMKNFQDYTRQDLVIINPYENISTESVTSADSVKVDFSIQGNNLVSGKENRIFVKVSGRENRELSGRVVSDGDYTSPFHTDSEGYGQIDLIPVEGEKYQLILEVESGFNFYDIPKACKSCQSLFVNPKNGGVQIIPIATSEGRGVVEIWTPQNRVFQKEIIFNNSLRVEYDAIPKGLLFVRLLDSGGNEIADEKFFNRYEKIKLESAVGKKFDERQAVQKTFSLAEASNINVSVQKSTLSYLPDPSLQLLNARLNDPLIINSLEFVDDVDLAIRLGFLDWRPKLSLLDEVSLLPEFRFDLIGGYVENFENLRPKPRAVGLFIQGSSYQLDVSEVNDEGRFVLSFDTPLEKQNSYVQVIGDTANIFQVVMENEFYQSYSDFNYPTIEFDSARVLEAINRSVHNQIENAYFQSKSDSTEVNELGQVGNYNVYFLDDYTRFPTIRDTFLEYIPEVAISKNEDKRSFDLRLLEYSPAGLKENLPPLLMLDGAPVSMSEALDVSPFTIEKIEILSRRYYFGNVAMNGIISLVSYSGDLDFDASAQKVELGVLEKTPNFETLVRPEHIPDRRELLFWEPSIDVGANADYQYDFTTSEIKGSYIITVTGVSASGKLINSRSEFIVE